MPHEGHLKNARFLGAEGNASFLALRKETTLPSQNNSSFSVDKTPCYIYLTKIADDILPAGHNCEAQRHMVLSIKRATAAQRNSRSGERPM